MLLIAIRDVLLLGLGGLIVRDMWHPELDVVRAEGVRRSGRRIFDRARDYFARDGHKTFLTDAPSAAPETVCGFGLCEWRKLRASNLEWDSDPGSDSYGRPALDAAAPRGARAGA